MRVLLEDVGFSYGALPVLEGVSFEIANGETVAIIGPSGCGKSTLLNLVGGMLEAQRGRIAAECLSCVSGACCRWSALC